MVMIRHRLGNEALADWHPRAREIRNVVDILLRVGTCHDILDQFPQLPPLKVAQLRRLLDAAMEECNCILTEIK